jgi:Ca-activated chloride channel family protein
MQSHKGKCYLVGRALAVTVAAALAAWPAEGPKGATADKATFRVDGTLVLVPVTVVDRRGAVVKGLASDAFTLTENGVQQPLRGFSEEDAPVSIGVVLDLSGSMAPVLGAAKESLRTLMKDANPGDEAFLNGVSSKPRVYSGFTEALGDIVRQVETERASGYTALIDTIYGSLEQLRTGVHPRKALVVISDGIDNRSRYTSRELQRLEVESDAQIYSIAVSGGAPRTQGVALAEEMGGLSFLRDLAEMTGGLSFVVRDGTDIAKATASIGRALRNQYTIGYVPSGNGQSGQWRRIRVKVEGSGMRAYARAGYRLD